MIKQKSWCSPTELSKQEERICARLKRNGKLFVFLRKNRHLIFTEAVHQKLLSMYSDYPRGKPMVCPMLLAMVSLLQAYEQESDASAVLESLFDQRWQMVLGCLGTEHPVFSQGVLCDFRHRLIKHNMDVMLLERTVEVAKEVGGFCYKQLRIALDSAPLEGAGRVEDTFNLIGHALELLVDCAAQIRQTSVFEIIKEAGTLFIGKKDFVIDLQKSIVTCPAGQNQRITGKPGSFRAKYSSKICGICPIKHKCSDSQTGRTISIHDQEAMLQTLKYYIETPEGRKEARERVKVEHVLASICNRKGTRARYMGIRLNEYDLNRTAMVTNLHIALNLAA